MTTDLDENMLQTHIMSHEPTRKKTGSHQCNVIMNLVFLKGAAHQRLTHVHVSRLSGTIWDPQCHGLPAVRLRIYKLIQVGPGSSECGQSEFQIIQSPIEMALPMLIYTPASLEYWFI